MKKIHISLVGGQPIPVYIGIKENGQANTVVLVCSAQSIVEAERIKAQFPKRDVQIRECSPTDLLQIEELANQLREQFNECELTINLTSGTKLWSLYFFRVFNEHNNVHFVYVDQNNLMVDVITKESRQCSIDKQTRFKLYGTPLKSFCSISEYTEADMRVMKDVEKIRWKNSKAFSAMTNGVDKANLDKEGVIPDAESGSSIRYDQLLNLAEITIKGRNAPITMQLQSEHVFDILFNAGWFEYKTALKLKQNPHVKDVWLNCIFADADGNPKNEIDIIVDLGYRLLFVECKTMVFNVTDIDKFRSALRNFSGTSSFGLFVTHDRPNNKTREKYNHALEKCKDNDIQTFNYSLRHDDPMNNPSLNDIINELLHRQNKR